MPMREIAPDWRGDPEGLSILSRRDGGEEREWVIWGEEAKVTDTLKRTGALVRATRPLTLSESVTVLMEYGSTQ